MSHTPGPWTILAEDYRVYAEDDYPVALASSHRESEQRLANAHLIAAAPDLLEACELMLTVAGLDREAPHAVNVMRAAIAKARGQP